MDRKISRLADAVPAAYVRVQVRPTITLKEAQLALEQIARRNGCENCGFSGIHVYFEQVINIAHELRSENIVSATVETNLNHLGSRVQGGVVIDG